MTAVEEIQRRIVEEFLEIGDDFDQYAYLIEISCSFKPMNPEDKRENRLVQGCQSRVWLKTYGDAEGRFFFEADSDTLIVKGVLSLLRQMFWGQRAEEVAEAQVTFLQETAIMETFESDRQKGLGYVIRFLQQKARLLAGDKVDNS